jgi:transposase
VPERWFKSYSEGGLQKLLKSRVSERGRQELVTPEAFEDLQEAMKRGEIATISEADEFLRERHGIGYAHPDGVGQLLRRRKVKLKTGRPRHEEADQQEQEAFKRTSPTPSAGAAISARGSRLRSWPSTTRRVSG